ncbi:MAG: hypothetical protein WAO35_22720 [Terriglobia bacterium]
MFGIPDDGRYCLRPIYVEDMAQLVAEAVDQNSNTVINAVGPETFRFEEPVKLIAVQVGRSVRLVHLPNSLAYVCTLPTGWVVRDAVLTWEEYKGLMANLPAPGGPPSGKTRLSEWLAENRERIGTRYASRWHGTT